MSRKSNIKTEDLVSMFTVQHLSSGQIQKLTGMSRAGIIKRLKSQDINTSKGKLGGAWVECTCDFCDKKIQKLRVRWRQSTKHFCSQECYCASLENPCYKPWRQGQRLAKAIVSQYFTLQDGNVIHHKDGDNRNNDRSNLSVYESQAHHMNHHRNGKAQPIWDGANL